MKIANHTNLEKVSDFYIINNSESEYKKALARRNNEARLNSIESRIESLDDKLNKILNILKVLNDN